MGIGLWQLLILALVIAVVAAFSLRVSRMGVRAPDEGSEKAAAPARAEDDGRS